MEFLVKLLKLGRYTRFIENVFSKNYTKRCLILYIAFPFVSDKQNDSHQNIWQVREMARIISEKGYVVDVADYNIDFLDTDQMYDLIIDISPRDYPVFEKNMKTGCVRIAYLTGSNPEFACAQEIKRVQECNRRRRANIVPRRQVALISKRMEDYEAIFSIGNDYNMATFDDFSLKQVVYLPNTGYELEQIERRNNVRNFMFLGSSGQIHKGLDLLLEVFSQHDFPYDLYICSPFKNERDFVKIYKKELYHTKNIHAIGFLNIHSKKIRDIASKCSFVILPSCSEAQAGSICTGMSLGLIPVCTPECGYNEDEVIMIDDVSIEGLSDVIIRCGNMDNITINKLRNRSYNYASEKHGRKNFADAFKCGIDAVIDNNERKCSNMVKDKQIISSGGNNV